MNKYEIMFVVRPDMEEAEIRKTAESMKKVLTDAKANIIKYFQIWFIFFQTQSFIITHK